MATVIDQLLSRTLFYTDGVTTVWDFSFSGGYLDVSHVKAHVEDTLGARIPITVLPSMLIGEYQLEITPALTAGDTLTIYRDTPKDFPLVNFTDESGFSEVSLDTNAKQAVFIAAEAADTINTTDIAGAIEASITAGGAADAATASASASSASALAASIYTDQAGDSAAAAAQAVAAASAYALSSSAFSVESAASASDAANAATVAADATVSAFADGLAASSGASLMGYLPAGAGAVATDAQSKLQQSVYVRDYGADPTGVFDSAAAFQNAINEMVLRGGGTVWVEPGLYKISTGLYANVGVVLQGTTRTDVSTNTNGGGSATATPTILWTGAAAGYMYSVRPAVVGNCVWGGGSVDIEWNGNDLAAVGVHLDNTKYAIFDGKVRQVTGTGVAVNSVSGSVTNFSMKNHIRSLEFVWGSAAACENANALALGGNTVNVPATQQLIGDVSGLVYNGALVYVAETDNAQFQSVHGSVQAGGTGCSVKLINAGAQPSHHNVFFYCVGPVKSDNGLIGNVFMNYNSEGGSFSQLAGTSSWDGELVDYVTGKRFTSHKYALRDKLSVSSGQFVGDINTVVSDFAFQWHSITLSGTTTQKAACVIPAPYRLEAGVIEGVEVIVGTNGTSAGNYRLALTCSTTVAAGPVVTPEKTDTQTLAAGAQYTPTKYTFTFSPELAFANNDHIFLGLSRLGGDALDTNTDAAFILGARILYRSSGPTSSGSGTYSIPAWD